MITLNISIKDINRAIKDRYTEDSDVSDLLLRTQKDLEDFILSAIEDKLNPQSSADIEKHAYMLGQKTRRL